MVTLWFKPGAAKLQVVKAIKETIHIGLRECRDAVELGRVQCDESERQLLTDAIEVAGGIVE